MTNPEFTCYFHNLLVDVLRTGDIPQHWKDAANKVLHKQRIDLIATTTERLRSLPIEDKYC